jgi:hypothetical protein
VYLSIPIPIPIPIPATATVSRTGSLSTRFHAGSVPGSLFVAKKCLAPLPSRSLGRGPCRCRCLVTGTAAPEQCTARVARLDIVRSVESSRKGLGGTMSNPARPGERHISACSDAGCWGCRCRCLLHRTRGEIRCDAQHWAASATRATLLRNRSTVEDRPCTLMTS